MDTIYHVRHLSMSVSMLVFMMMAVLSRIMAAPMPVPQMATDISLTPVPSLTESTLTFVTSAVSITAATSDIVSFTSTSITIDRPPVSPTTFADNGDNTGSNNVHKNTNINNNNNDSKSGGITNMINISGNDSNNINDDSGSTDSNNNSNSNSKNNNNGNNSADNSSNNSNNNNNVNTVNSNSQSSPPSNSTIIIIVISSVLSISFFVLAAKGRQMIIRHRDKNHHESTGQPLKYNWSKANLLLMFISPKNIKSNASEKSITEYLSETDSESSDSGSDTSSIDSLDSSDTDYIRSKNDNLSSHLVSPPPVVFSTLPPFAFPSSSLTHESFSLNKYAPKVSSSLNPNKSAALYRTSWPYHYNIPSPTHRPHPGLMTQDHSGRSEAEDLYYYQIKKRKAKPKVDYRRQASINHLVMNQQLKNCNMDHVFTAGVVNSDHVEDTNNIDLQDSLQITQKQNFSIDDYID